MTRDGFHGVRVQNADTPRLTHEVVLSHPDFDRRPWIFTRSADPALADRRSRAFSYYSEITAGGELHPALRTINILFIHITMSITNKKLTCHFY